MQLAEWFALHGAETNTIERSSRGKQVNNSMRVRGVRRFCRTRNKYIIPAVVVLMLGISFQPADAYHIQLVPGNSRVRDQSSAVSMNGPFSAVTDNIVRPPEWVGWCLLSLGSTLRPWLLLVTRAPTGDRWCSTHGAVATAVEVAPFSALTPRRWESLVARLWLALLMNKDLRSIAVTTLRPWRSSGRGFALHQQRLRASLVRPSPPVPRQPLLQTPVQPQLPPYLQGQPDRAEFMRRRSTRTRYTSTVTGSARALMAARTASARAKFLAAVEGHVPLLPPMAVCPPVGDIIGKDAACTSRMDYGHAKQDTEEAA